MSLGRTLNAIFHLGAKQSTRCVGPAWRKTCKHNSFYVVAVWQTQSILQHGVQTKKKKFWKDVYKCAVIVSIFVFHLITKSNSGFYSWDNSNLLWEMHALKKLSTFPPFNLLPYWNWTWSKLKRISKDATSARVEPRSRWVGNLLGGRFSGGSLMESNVSEYHASSAPANAKELGCLTLKNTLLFDETKAKHFHYLLAVKLTNR